MSIEIIMVVILTLMLWGIIILQQLYIRSLNSLLDTYRHVYKETYDAYMDIADRYNADLDDWKKWLDEQLKE